jgi:hypothetical protein
MDQMSSANLIQTEMDNAVAALRDTNCPNPEPHITTLFEIVRPGRLDKPWPGDLMIEQKSITAQQKQAVVDCLLPYLTIIDPNTNAKTLETSVV